MVNEINKPPSSENIILGERLAASNRQLQEMQDEHRQLMQEMELLRERAANLSRLNAQQSDNHTTDTPPQENSTSNPGSISLAESVIEDQTTPAVEETVTNTAATPLPTLPTPNAAESKQDHDDTPDEESAEYIRQKIAELASLKAQYARVKQMIATTDLIEKHIEAKNSNSVEDNSSSNTIDVSSPPAHQQTQVECAELKESILPDQTFAPPAGSENEELLSAMMNMFTDFTADLRSQAESLRAERDRIRVLKEELLLRRRGGQQ